MMKDMDKGLYAKYIVTKADGMPLNGDCFVLRPDRDAAAAKALLAYAASTPNEELSSDIRIWLASIGVDMSAPDEVSALRAENARLQRKLVIANDAILDFMECIELGEPYRRGKEIAEKYHRAVAETEEPNE